jgi:hypothetical protein
MRLGRWRSRKRQRPRNPLPKPLMRSSLIEVDDIGLEEAVELLLMKDQEMIQAFSSHASQKSSQTAFARARSIRHSKHLDPTGSGHSRKNPPKFLVIIPDEICWGLSIRSRFSQLLCNPRVGWRSGHIYMDDLPRFQFDDEEGEKRTEEEIRDMEKIAGPHLCRMSAQKGFPGLSTSLFWTDLLHMLLDGPFTHSYI